LYYGIISGNNLCPGGDYAAVNAEGAAMYAVVVITVFATGIGCFIGMMSFKQAR